MNTDEFRDYILGFIFYKYLSQRMNLSANAILKEDGISYESKNENTKEGKAILEAIRKQALIKLGRTESARNGLIAKVLRTLTRLTLAGKIPSQVF